MAKKQFLLGVAITLALYVGVDWGYQKYLEVQEVIAQNNQYLGYMLCKNEGSTKLERASLKGDTWVIQEYL